MGNISISFDQNGYITPYDVTIANYEVFKETFAWNDYRKDLLVQYEHFIEQLQRLLPVEHKQ